MQTWPTSSALLHHVPLLPWLHSHQIYFCTVFRQFLKCLKEASIAETPSDWVPRDLQVGSWPHPVPALVTATTHSSEFWNRHLLLVLALDCKWEHLRWDESLARQGDRHTVPRASWQGRPIPSLGRLIPDRLPAKPHDPPRTGSQATCTAEPALEAVWGHCDTSPSRPRSPQRAAGQPNTDCFRLAPFLSPHAAEPQHHTLATTTCQQEATQICET